MHARFCRQGYHSANGYTGPRQQVDSDTICEAAAIGLTGIRVPAKVGGLGHKFSGRARIVEILASADFGFAMSIINTQNVAQKPCGDAAFDVVDRSVLDILSGERLGRTALTEPHAGSDFAAIKSTVRREGARWLSNGPKAWIINSVATDVLVVYPQTESPEVVLLELQLSLLTASVMGSDDLHRLR